MGAGAFKRSRPIRVIGLPTRLAAGLVQGSVPGRNSSPPFAFLMALRAAPFLLPGDLPGRLRAQCLARHSDASASYGAKPRPYFNFEYQLIDFIG